MMSSLKVSDEQIAKLIMPLAAPADSKLLDAAECASELFSRATLSLLTEPGDRFAGALLSQLGATKLLSFLVHDAVSSQLRQALNESSDSAVDSIENHFNSRFSELWTNSVERWKPRLNFANLQDNLERFARLAGSLVWPGSQFYAPNLDVLGWSAPHVLWVRGNTETLGFSRSVAIVGSRTATNYGAAVTADLVSVAAEKNITTVSGGAFGIDSLLHRSSLVEGAKTIAVMAGGLDALYPRSNEMLFEEILRENAIIAEVGLGVAPAKWRFLQRNRLIAALGDATVVVEAGSRSGSINTANIAIQLERPVGVVPGSVLSSTSFGCHRLAKEHPSEVQLVCDGKDMLALIGESAIGFELEESLGVLETRALDAFSTRVLSFVDVQRIAGLTTTETQLALGQLEMQGYLERRDQGFVRLRHTL